ncbi:F-box/LRR-repeat protein 14-like [Prorops nasuta]|uniref:F-box/LRR-repeat protein 14-like n=1 Tax=Prorops nasuta TaxID=863751 RepID=UPI0034CD5AF5
MEENQLLMTELPPFPRRFLHSLHQPHLTLPTRLRHQRSQDSPYNRPQQNRQGNTSQYWRATNQTNLPAYVQGISRQEIAQQTRGAGETVSTSTHISCLYPEILALIFSYLDVRDKGQVAQVCTAWRDAANYKSVWRGVEARLHIRTKQAPILFNSLVRRGVKRVQVLSIKSGFKELTRGMPNLESLSLSGCFNLTDSSLVCGFCQEYPSLIRLNLSLCKQVSDASLGRIAQSVKNLEQLELGGCCGITNFGLSLIAWGLKKLKRLDLRSCWHISDQGIAHLAGRTQETADGNLELEYLSLQDCQRLTDEALKHISVGLSKLKSINLSFCVCITDSGIKHLSKMTSLRELNLRSCDNISDHGMAFLAEGGSRLISLDVSFCDKIGDRALEHISQSLFNLKALSLSACQISDVGMCKIAKTLHELEILHIGQCQRLTDKCLISIFENMKQLRSIDLYGCTRVTTDGIAKIMRLPFLYNVNRGLHVQR